MSAASYVTDKLKQDAYKAAALEAAIPREHLRVINERYESDLLAQANKQTANDPNSINSFAHRWVASESGSDGVISLEDFAYAKLALDKASIQDAGRIAIVDPIVEMTINTLMTTANAVSYNPQFEGIVESGFGQAHRFVRNIFGFDVYVSNRLPTSSDSITGGPNASAGAKSVTGGIVNQFMCIADDQHKPYMGAFRQMPTTEGYRNVTFKRDEYSTTARWGFGLQRPEALVSVITSASKYE